MKSVQFSGRVSRQVLLWGALLASVSTPALAAETAHLTPMTKFRLTVVQFVASLGDYKKWDALGGEFEVAADGTVTVPSLGAIDVSGYTADELGAEIARRLQTKLGLRDAPDASVQVTAYPPIYIVGNVSTPGQYDYRPGMTVVQALALAGGEQRINTAVGMSETIRLESDLIGFGSEILRGNARLARLKTELALGDKIDFPTTLSPSDPTAAEIMDQEKLIFDAHTNGMARQKTGLEQLAELYNAEIDALSQKEQAITDQIARAEKQLATITDLVASGSATVSRQNDAERVLADLRSERLDNIIGSMTARENLNRSQRDLAKLVDDQQSEVANQIQDVQAGLEKLTQQQTATMRMLNQSVAFDDKTMAALGATTELNYSILRQQSGTPVTMSATEASTLLPGDLVKVTMQMQPPAAGTPSPGLADASR